MLEKQIRVFRLLKIDLFYYSIIIIGLYVVFSLLFNHLFISETILTRWYEGDYSHAQVQSIIDFTKKWEWGFPVLNVVIVFIRIGFVTTCLFLGLFFFTNHFNSHKISFNIVLKSEFVFVLYTIVRVIWFGFIYIPDCIEAWQVAPLSLMHFFDPAIIETWLIYPLNTINVFEVLYIWMLSALMAVAIQTTFRKAFEIVFVSYGAGLLLLIVAQMFIILNST